MFNKAVVSSLIFEGTLGFIGGGCLTSPHNMHITSSFSVQLGDNHGLQSS